MSINEEYSATLTTVMSEKLRRFSNQIKQIDVQLWDEDRGMNDKHCLLEAQLDGKRPVAVTDYANTHEQAIEGAVEKLKFSLDNLLGIGQLSIH